MEQPIVTDIELLSKISRPATPADSQIIEDLRDTLAAHHDECVGLAANMIGSRTGIYMTKEGCLSLTDVHRATRFENVTVVWQDADFTRHMRGFSGYTAQIIQHEVDHLDGKII